MKKHFVFVLLFQFLNYAYAQHSKSIIEEYSSKSRVRSGVALGGIGTGSIELRKDGNFYNWSIFNNYPFSTGAPFSLHTYKHSDDESSLLFFLVRYQVEGSSPQIKLLQINSGLSEAGLESSSYYYPWMSAVDNITYEATFPFVKMTFSDDEMPFDITLKAFSPFIPHDVKHSSLPGVYFDFEVISKTKKIVDVMLVGTLRNLAGYDVFEKSFTSDLIKDQNSQFFIHSVEGMDEKHPTNGKMGLGMISQENLSHYLGWEHKHPYYEKLLVEKELANIDDTKNRNIKTDDGGHVGRFSFMSNDQRCFSSIGVSKKMNQGDTLKATALMAWDFPNNYGAHKGGEPSAHNKPMKSDNHLNLKTTKIIGHYHNSHLATLSDVVHYMFQNKNMLKNRSEYFQEGFYDSDIDTYILDQVNSQFNTFITSSTLTKNGDFLMREGLTPSRSWGPTATIDVSLYASVMTLALFPELQKSMMRSHRDIQTPEGEISHGISYDPGISQNGTWEVYDRLDLVPNYIQMVLRDYRWSNDKEYLNEMWPSIKKGIDYLLENRDEDGDQMPEMDGIMCSYDNFPMYGLASYIQSQWIVAAKMASDAAFVMGDDQLGEKYRNISEKGLELMESQLWNGKYYRLSNDYLGDRGLDEGCLTDQLIGQWVARTAGLDELFDSKRVTSALESIIDHSMVDSSYLRNCTWPDYPEMYPIHTSDLWVDQANTAWTGVELAFSSFLIYEGLVEEGKQVIKGVDDRYREAGLYWDHQEFGGHYYRPMSAWAIINAFAGFSLVNDHYSFNPKIEDDNFKLFIVSNQGSGHLIKSKHQLKLRCYIGTWNIEGISIPEQLVNTKFPEIYFNDMKIKYQRLENEGFIKIVFEQPLVIKRNEELVLK